MVKGKPKTTERIFYVFETIAREGPISLNDLTDHLGLPRSAVHRAVQTLQKREWVRARLYDHCYELSSRFDMFMANCNAAQIEVEEIAPIMAEYSREGLHVDFGLFTKNGWFETLESTDKAALLNKPHSLLASPMALCVMARLTVVEQIRHTDAYLKFCSPAEKRQITNGALTKTLKSVGQEPISNQEYLHSAAIQFSTQNFGAIGLRQKSKPPKNVNDTIRALQEALSDFSKNR